jgi:hypothetical protein
MSREPILETVNCRVMDSGLAVVRCTACEGWHVHIPKPELVQGRCGAAYRLRLVEDPVSEDEARAIRRELKGAGNVARSR